VDGKGLVLGVGGATYHFEFKRGEDPQRILKSDFERVLSKEVRVISTEKNPEGVAECLFELAPSRKGRVIDVPALACEACGAKVSGLESGKPDTIVHKKDCPNFGTARLNVPGQESKD
jgi:hypothetical protein